MANQISLSPEQINRLNQITSKGEANFAEGYRYILGLIENDPNVDDYTKFFFKGARQVNGNFIADSNVFIRGLTEAGLAWDGRLKSDPVERALQIQKISDDIARNVIKQINADKGIPPLDTILQSDARTAVTEHDQTVGGWGGAFYYWNTKFTPDGKTVGEAIMADPAELEKFIAINAQALVDTSLRQGLSPDQLKAPFNAQAPWAIKQAILTRANEVIFGGASFAGDPYNIDGYVPIVDRNERPVGWRLGGGDEITDPPKIDELNKRYEIRLWKSEDPSWQGIQPQSRIEQNPSAPTVPAVPFDNRNPFNDRSEKGDSPLAPSPVLRAPLKDRRSAGPDALTPISAQGRLPATPASQPYTAGTGGVLGKFIWDNPIAPAEAVSPLAQETPLLRPYFPGQESAVGDRSKNTPGVPSPGSYPQLRRVSSAFPGMTPPDPDQPAPPQSGRPLGIFTGKPMPSWTTPPPPLGGLLNNSSASGIGDPVNFLTSLLPRNPAQLEPPQQTADSIPERRLGRSTYSVSPASVFDSGAAAVPLAPSADANYSGGLLGMLAAPAGSDPNQPAPPDDEQEQADLQALEAKFSSSGNINDAWALYKARMASRR